MERGGYEGRVGESRDTKVYSESGTTIGGVRRRGLSPGRSRERVSLVKWGKDRKFRVVRQEVGGIVGVPLQS